MSAAALVWLVTAVGLVVLLALAGVRVQGARRELARAQARVAAYGDLPVVAALHSARADLERLQAAGPRVAPLLDRIQPALATIRRGPVPPDLIAAIAYLRTQLADLRSFRRG